MRKILISLVTIGMLLSLCACSFGRNNENVIEDVDVEFSEKYLVGLQSGGGYGEKTEIWDQLRSEYRICYDGTVEIYIQSVEDGEIADYELAGAYQLTDEEINNLKTTINLKKLYNLDPKEDREVCDGTSKYLYVYDNKDEVLKKCGGYMPSNKSFLEMYEAVKSVLRYEEHSRVKEEWISKLKGES